MITIADTLSYARTGGREGKKSFICYQSYIQCYEPFLNIQGKQSGVLNPSDEAEDMRGGRAQCALSVQRLLGLQ